ncbi:MAG: type II toxin-antitoxin system VapC family toxin [Terriglobales bacterium]
MLNLDTHILLATAENSLHPAERAALTRERRQGISAIVLWEVEILYRTERIPYGLDDDRLAGMVDSVTIWPISVEVGLALRRLDFHADPADELIAATSLAHHVPLLTRDRRLRQSRLLRRLGLIV